MVSQNIELKVPVVSFIGNSGSGKTTLLEKVVRELKRLGYRVAVVKHAPHGFDIDQPAKDTWRLAQAGSDIVAILAPNKMAFVQHVDAEPTLSQMGALFVNKVDIVLAEGYKNGNTAKILVLDTRKSQDSLCGKEELLTTVSAHLSSVGELLFDDGDVARIVNLVIEQIVENLPHKFGDISQATDFTPGYLGHKTHKGSK